MTTKSGKSVDLQAMTMIDPATGWIEICAVPATWADIVANLVEREWLIRYSLLRKVIVERGNEFLAEFRNTINNLLEDPIKSLFYGIYVYICVCVYFGCSELYCFMIKFD